MLLFVVFCVAGSVLGALYILFSNIFLKKTSMEKQIAGKPDSQTHFLD